MTSTQLATWDFTLPVDRNDDLNTVFKNLNEWCKKWVFQREKGQNSGYDHYQGRVSLIKRSRRNELIAKTQDVFPGIHWSPTSNEVHEGQNFNYVMKADTRIDGPWTDKDFVEPPVLTRQLRKFHQMAKRPWQCQVESMVKEEDDRSIKLIIDRVGNSGKSIFAEYLEYHGLAWEIPPFRLMEDIMQCVISIKEKKCYVIDMPRAMKKDKLSEFYSGLEALKNGVCYDKRYRFKKRRMDRPQVVVFTNKDPCWDYMSEDRWEVYDMNPGYTLSLRSDLPQMGSAIDDDIENLILEDREYTGDGTP